MKYSQVEVILISFVVFFVVYLLLKIKNRNNEEIKIEDRQCPGCGGENFSLGKQVGFASIYSVKNPIIKGSHVTHVICKSCGRIVESYVEKPEEFK